MPHTSTDRLPIRSPRAFVLVLTFKGIVVSVVQTLLTPVLEDLPQLLDTEPDTAAWVITSTLLAGAVTTPIMGRLGDLHGKRRMLICSLVPPSENCGDCAGPIPILGGIERLCEVDFAAWWRAVTPPA